MNWTSILEGMIPGVARLWVFDKGHEDSLGRYVVAKTFKDTLGHFRRTQTYYHQRPAALAYADKWLADRKSKMASSKPK